MRQAYAHQAVLIVPPDGNDGAPGAAITAALCGAIEHEPPCPRAAHHTSATRDGDEVRLRILFATAPHRVDEVRGLIDSALAAGTFPGADGVPTHWRTVDSGCARVDREEHAQARRLLK
jgi:hypothetical protein